MANIGCISEYELTDATLHSSRVRYGVHFVSIC